jgi:hypothetical protein
MQRRVEDIGERVIAILAQRHVQQTLIPAQGM